MEEDKPIVGATYLRTVIYKRDNYLHTFKNRVVLVIADDMWCTFTRQDKAHPDDPYGRDESGLINTDPVNFPVGLEGNIQIPAEYITYTLLSLPEQEQEFMSGKHNKPQKGGTALDS